MSTRFLCDGCSVPIDQTRPWLRGRMETVCTMQGQTVISRSIYVDFCERCAKARGWL